MKVLPAICLIFLTLFCACTDSEKEKQLEKREQELVTKENEFALKEQEFESLKAIRDSLNQIDVEIDTVEISTAIPAEIVGKYNGKMVCTETDCTEHVIGDQRNDQWEITEKGVKITNKTGGETFYSGTYSNSEIKLKSEKGDPAATVSEITLQIPETSGTRLKGTRELKRENCVSKFSVDLEKIKTK